MFDAVSLVRCDEYSKEKLDFAIGRVLEEIDGLSFVHEKMTIGIKVNLVAGMAPEKAATTEPLFLRTLCEKLILKGAKVVIGDSPGGIYTSAFVHGVYRACGLTDMVKELQGQYDDGENKVSLNEDFSVKNGEFPDAVSIKNFIYTGWLDNVDAIINVSKLKTHAMMGMSCAVKNMFGTIPGTTKPEYHMRFSNEQAFANVMVDLNEYFKPCLYLVDAIDGMEGNGPTAGEKRHIGCVLSSKKPYALDMVCADIIGMKLSEVPTLLAAKERGLGPDNVSEVTVCGDLQLSEIRVTDFKRATIHQSITFDGNGIIGKLQSKALMIVFNTKPNVKEKECIGCKKCHETCPAHAITMVRSDKANSGKGGMIPQIDRSKCIKCFCCQEFCPKGAMKVQYNPLGRFVNKVNHR
ncbi:DUF362 domain-containing protein [Butyrivibrio sp. YAB3001]|uniref:DUF362 domain-containing protein n=1 Tax=Butyrivibrio sp. YAB3001 TaxID=1520812 RepID=UPI0008F66453|nr:DUF362 domain-containing protein [Butyrivibrio sp. YAB3001]SFB76226.1 Uncharacterized conserved protein, DUF362 family [Butyrivibrio sp. YAB3001]